jgi:[acyl-carrier-protein] S-malonyltransferase
MSVAYVFPGQGSQAVGMGKALADAFTPARVVFDEVDAALGEKLTKVIWEGPAETLTLTENAQPASISRAMQNSWPATRWANIQRSPPPAR